MTQTGSVAVNEKSKDEVLELLYEHLKQTRIVSIAINEGEISFSGPVLCELESGSYLRIEAFDTGSFSYTLYNERVDQVQCTPNEYHDSVNNYLIHDCKIGTINILLDQ